MIFASALTGGWGGDGHPAAGGLVTLATYSQKPGYLSLSVAR